MMGVGRMAMAKRGARGKSKDDLSGLFGSPGGVAGPANKTD